MYIGLLPIDEGVIDVGRADEDTDGYIGHDRPFSAYCNLVSWPLHFAKARTSRLTSERYHMCVCGVNAQSGSSFQGGFNTLLRYMVHRMPGLCTIFTDPFISSGMMRVIGRKKEEATSRVSGACSHGKPRLPNCATPGMLVARSPLVRS